MLPNNTSLFETILVSINDKFVELFLNNKIKFTDISKKMNKMLNLYSFKKYKKIKPKNIEEIIKMNTKIKNDIEYFNKKIKMFKSIYKIILFLIFFFFVF